MSPPSDTDSEPDADDARPKGLLAAVQDAAVERALVDGDDAARHLAVAGGLERARCVAAERSGGPDSDDDPFAPALLAVATLAAFDANEGRIEGENGGDGALGPAEGDSPASPPGTLSPAGPTVGSAPGGGGASKPPAGGDAVAEGAAVAVRRFGADVRRAATLADVSVAALERRVDDASR